MAAELNKKPASKIVNFFGFVIVCGLLFIFVAYPILSAPYFNQLEKIQQRGSIRFVSYNSASTMIYSESGRDGFEYQIAEGFAKHIGVTPEYQTVQNYIEIENQIIFKDADIAAAGLSELNTDNDMVRFGPKYFQVTPQIIYKKGSHRFENFEKFADTHLEVTANNSNLRLLQELKEEDAKDLTWSVLEETGSEEAIEMVNDGFIRYLITDSHNFALQRRFYPELRISFELEQKKPLKWMLKNINDASLIDAVHDYFQTIKSDGRLKQWIHRYLSHVEKFNYSDITTFEKMLKNRLPKYQKLFELAAKKNDLDWHLLAAIGYQESLWNEKAKSPTGVRGLMMLTKATAKQMKVKNRLDPVESIKGGAKYIKRVMKKIPARIQQPDRTWLALASYNVGYGHLEDARKITQTRGGDPDKWIDVKQSLPLLSRKKWYKKTRYGYARGSEPVKYVENIRKYLDLLMWHSKAESDKAQPVKPPEKPKENVIQLSPSL